jgi:hypothetical protein
LTPPPSSYTKSNPQVEITDEEAKIIAKQGTPIYRPGDMISIARLGDTSSDYKNAPFEETLHAS